MRFIKFRRLTIVGVLYLFSLSVLITSTSPIVNAQNEGLNPRIPFYSLNDILFYDDQYQACVTGGAGGEEGGSSAIPTGNDNTEIAFKYFLGKGLNAIQTAGILGNLMQESGMDPKAVQSGGPGRGLAQWSVGQRWADLQKFASSNGRDQWDLGLQLDFIWHEMNNVPPWDKTLPAMKASVTIEGAVEAFEKNYEKAGKPNYANRYKFAHEIYDLYSTLDPGDGGTGGTTSRDCSDLSGPGQDTQFIDGFTVYSQYDPDWKDLPYGSSTIGQSGCGPAAMAMIITALTGQTVTPVQTANYAASQGMLQNGGSSHSIGPVVAEQWGLRSEFVGNDIAKINQALQNGGLVITVGGGPKPFTEGGHFIVIRAVTSSGKWMVGDSAHNDTSDKEWDPQQIVSNMRSGGSGTYAIYK